MAGKRNAYRKKLYVRERDREDDSQIDRVTLHVTTRIVELDNFEKAVVLSSSNPKRQPRMVDEERALRRALRNFEPTIWSKPKGMKWCSARDHWVKASREYFSPDSRTADKLQNICKECRASQARLNYATSLEREVRPYTRRDLRAA